MAGHLSSSAKVLVKSGSSSSKCLVVADRLSTLHSDIRSRILSLLPTIDAAKVGLLSKLLRSACYSLSRLSFDYCQFPETENKLVSFVNFIDQTIAHHDESDVTTLELWLWPFFDCEVPIKSMWVIFAIMHRVEKLVLYGKLDQMKLPNLLFTCQTLVKLELAIPDLVFALENLTLPNLWKLKLKFLRLAKQTMGDNLLLNFPALRKFSMFYCSLESPKDISISSEKLEEFIMYCPWINDCALKLQAPCLSSFIYINNNDEVKMDLNINPSALQFVINDGGVTVVNGRNNELIPLLIKATKELFKSSYLSLSHWLIEYLSMAHDLLKQATPGQFHGILVLDMEIWPIMDHLVVLTFLVSRCPNLKELSLVLLNPQRRALQLPSEDILAEYGTAGGFLSVQSVEIESFGGNETELMFVRFLLANMIKLLWIRIELDDLMGEDRRLMISEILDYEKASEIVDVIFE